MSPFLLLAVVFKFTLVFTHPYSVFTALCKCLTFPQPPRATDEQAALAIFKTSGIRPLCVVFLRNFANGLPVNNDVVACFTEPISAEGLHVVNDGMQQAVRRPTFEEHQVVQLLVHRQNRMPSVIVPIVDGGGPNAGYLRLRGLQTTDIFTIVRFLEIVLQNNEFQGGEHALQFNNEILAIKVFGRPAANAVKRFEAFVAFRRGGIISRLMAARVTHTRSIIEIYEISVSDMIQVSVGLTCYLYNQGLLC